MFSHDIDYHETFARREPALKAMNIPYTLSDDKKKITLDRNLTDFSPHQRDVVEFAINPLVALKIFGGLNPNAVKAIAEAIKQTYIDGNGNW